MAEKSSRAFWRLQNPIMWACLVTLAFVGLILCFGLASTCNEVLFPKGDCPPKWRHLLVAPPNEVGDTLAGLAGVLAFVWLIATVLLQATELREQREEFERMADAQSAQAILVERQTSILYRERELREQAEYRSYTNELISSLARALQMEASRQDLNRPFFVSGLPRLKIFEPQMVEETAEEYVFRNSHAVGKFIHELAQGTSEGAPPFRGSRQFYTQIEEVLFKISACGGKLGRDQAEKLRSLGIWRLSVELSDFLKADIWHEDASKLYVGSNSEEALA